MTTLSQRLDEELGRDRPAELPSQTRRFRIGNENVFVTITYIWKIGEQPYEIFFAYSKSGNPHAERMKTIGRLCNLALRRGATPEEVAISLIGVKETQVSFEDGYFYWGPIDAAGKWLLRMSVDSLECNNCGHDIDKVGHYLECEVRE